nr:MAG TPA: nucleoporin [Caudoviricetes sp.]
MKMFNFKDNNNDDLLKIIDQLREENNKLKNELNEVANNTGNCIIKQLPDGSMELNGVPFDNTSDVDYYNSAKATFSELTMFRVGKETKQREMDKLIKIHMEEVDELKQQILSLNNNNSELINQLHESESINVNLNETIKNKDSQIDNLNKKLDDAISQAKLTLDEIKKRYEMYIEHLNKDVETWKERYLKINNTTLDGTIITKYGKVLNNKGEEINE